MTLIDFNILIDDLLCRFCFDPTVENIFGESSPLFNCQKRSCKLVTTLGGWYPFEEIVYFGCHKILIFVTLLKASWRIAQKDFVDISTVFFFKTFLAVSWNRFFFIYVNSLWNYLKKIFGIFSRYFRDKIRNEIGVIETGIACSDLNVFSFLFEVVPKVVEKNCSYDFTETWLRRLREISLEDCLNFKARGFSLFYFNHSLISDLLFEKAFLIDLVTSEETNDHEIVFFRPFLK